MIQIIQKKQFYIIARNNYDKFTDNYGCNRCTYVTKGFEPLYDHVKSNCKNLSLKTNQHLRKSVLEAFK